jgi:hypothetical protein
MLPRKEDEEWSLRPHAERDYDSDVERRFFERIDNPRPVTPAMRELVRDVGRYLKNSD